VENNSGSRLTFAVRLTDGTDLQTLQDMAAHLAALSEEQRRMHHWKVAVQALKVALNESVYLGAATISLQTACLLDGLLEQPPLVPH
jgi:hypothetical protein